jgi:hypothetical protein
MVMEESLDVAGYFEKTVADAVIGMFDDVRCGLVRCQLDVIDFLVIESAHTGNLPDELTDLIQKFELRGKLDSLHRILYNTGSFADDLGASPITNDVALRVRRARIKNAPLQ